MARTSRVFASQRPFCAVFASSKKQVCFYDALSLYLYAIALLYLVTWPESYGVRAWKSFDCDTMSRLHEKGWISDPKSKAKSVAMTEEGYRKSQEIFRQLFGKDD